VNRGCARITTLSAGVLTALALVVPSAAGAVQERAAISSHCSRATANALLTKLGFVSQPGIPPAADVLCGHFTGPKSNAMAVTQAIPSCGASISWFVFQFSGGDWRMKLKQPSGAFLDTIGTRIRETHFVLRPFDAHCFPTGGTVSRIWRWNGHGFSHTAFKRSGAMFVSPTRNLWCVMAIKKVDCQSAKPSHSARLNTRGAVRTCKGTSCAEEGTEPERVQVLRYGHALAIGAFRCSASTKGITCVARANHRGFRISKSGTVRVS
jgi:hypothetical protein